MKSKYTPAKKLAQEWIDAYKLIQLYEMLIHDMCDKVYQMVEFSLESYKNILDLSFDGDYQYIRVYPFRTKSKRIQFAKTILEIQTKAACLKQFLIKWKVIPEGVKGALSLVEDKSGGLSIYFTD